jgi:two-component system cell cycle sensor histidine kinase/response regulator CckA
MSSFLRSFGPAPVSGATEQPPTILIVDDSLDARLVLQTLLSNQGYSLAFAADGFEGLQKAADLIPDLILLDVMMPGMDGLEVCRNLRANPLLCDVPIIMVTALEDRDMRLQGIIAGADDFISKRFDSTELRARVRTITRLNRYRHLLGERLKFERVVEFAPNGLLIVNGAGAIILANPAMLRMLGLQRQDEVLGKSLDLWVEPLGRGECYACLAEVIADAESTVRFDTVLLRVDGKPFPAEIDIGHVNWDETPMAQVAVRDITKRRELEAQLLQSQKMESIGRLAGGVAHDFNNLLTAISGYTEMALESLPAEARERNDLLHVQKAADSASALTRQLLAFARKQTIEPRVFSPNDRLHDLNALLRRLIGEDIDLIVRPAPDLGLIRADPGQIEQVLINLVVNARDAMPQGGTLTIETANLMLRRGEGHMHSRIAEGQYVVLVVSDTGVGMDEAIMRHIFEPFFTTKEPGHGTGMGLATCYGIVEQHGGTLEVYSELYRGTTFKIYLPRVQGVADTIPSSVDAGQALPRGAETVLLVEDNLAVRALVTRVLGGLGYTILEAGDGIEALQLAGKRAGAPIDLLMTDVIIPRLGGKPLAERMAVLYPGIKVLFMSGYIEHVIVQHSRLSEGVAFLQKPFSAATLARKVRDVLDG